MTFRPRHDRLVRVRKIHEHTHVLKHETLTQRHLTGLHCQQADKVACGSVIPQDWQHLATHAISRN